MRLEFHCVVHLNALKREEGKRAELQNKFGILYRESIMTLEETGSLSTVRCYCLLKGNTGMSLLLCGAGNENTRGELSCSEYSWGELVLAFEPGLIYLRTVSDMSAGAGSKMSKGQYSGKKDKVMGQCSFWKPTPTSGCLWAVCIHVGTKRGGGVRMHGSWDGGQRCLGAARRRFTASPSSGGDGSTMLFRV